MSLKVLIIDDEPLIRRSLARVFRDRGYIVEVAEDGYLGLAVWAKMQPDIVFLDVLMPGLTGPEVIAKLGSGYASKVILMSAYSGMEPEKLGVRFDHFLSKPFDDVFKLVDLAESLIK